MNVAHKEEQHSETKVKNLKEIEDVILKAIRKSAQKKKMNCANISR